ncbi:hypothetical protein L204_104170 [Cryptococcus depauperatus]
MDTSHTLAPADMSATISATTSHLASEPGQRPLPPPPFVAGSYPPPRFPDLYAAPGYDYGAAAPSWLPPTDLADVRTELLEVGAAGAQVKHRRRTTPEQLKVLEFWYELHPKPDNELRERLAAQLGMTKRNVQAGKDEGARAEGGGGAGRGAGTTPVRRPRPRAPDAGGLRDRAAGKHRQRRGGAARQHPVPGVQRPDVAGDAGGAVGAAHGGAPQRAPPVGAQPGRGTDAAHAAAVERAVHAAAGRLDPAPGGRRARRERARDDWRRRGAAVCRLAPRARRLPLALAAAEPVVLVWLAAGRVAGDGGAAVRAVHDDAGPGAARQPRWLDVPDGFDPDHRRASAPAAPDRSHRSRHARHQAESCPALAAEYPFHAAPARPRLRAAAAAALVHAARRRAVSTVHPRRPHRGHLTVPGASAASVHRVPARLARGAHAAEPAGGPSRRGVPCEPVSTGRRAAGLRRRVACPARRREGRRTPRRACDGRGCGVRRRECAGLVAIVEQRYCSCIYSHVKLSLRRIHGLLSHNSYSPAWRSGFETVGDNGFLGSIEL